MCCRIPPVAHSGTVLEKQVRHCIARQPDHAVAIRDQALPRQTGAVCLAHHQQHFASRLSNNQGSLDTASAATSPGLGVSTLAKLSKINRSLRWISAVSVARSRAPGPPDRPDCPLLLHAGVPWLPGAPGDRPATRSIRSRPARRPPVRWRSSPLPLPEAPAKAPRDRRRQRRLAHASGADHHCHGASVQRPPRAPSAARQFPVKSSANTESALSG